MTVRIGYLLPTRESIMEGRPEAEPLLALAERAEKLGYDSVWVGDSLTARPRHEPITLLAGVAARTRRVKLGTAVLLPALCNPVILAHQFATLDQVSTDRVILGIVWCFVIAGFAVSGFYALSLALLFLAGFLELSFNAMAMTLVQLQAPAAIRGRVIGLYSMSALGLRAFSGITVGVVGGMIGIHWSLALSAMVLLVIISAQLAFSLRPRAAA